MQETLPIRRTPDGCEILDLGNTIVIRGDDGSPMLTLDPRTSVVWLMCDGRRRVQDIVEVFASGWNLPEHLAAKLVDDTIDWLAESGLLDVEQFAVAA